MSIGVKFAFGALGFVLALIVASVVWFKTHTPIGLQQPCPPPDQCAGSPATNHPRCDCWDSK